MKIQDQALETPSEYPRPRLDSSGTPSESWRQRLDQPSSLKTQRNHSLATASGKRRRLPNGNDLALLRSDTIRLLQNGCSFHGLRSEDLNQHLKDFLKIMDPIDLNVETRERTCLRLFQFSLRDQASNWLERLPTGSITTWEDFTTCFLAQFFPPRKTSKLQNDILMFQQHQGKSLSEALTRFKDLLQKVPHHAIDLWLQIQIFYNHVNPIIKRTIDQAAGGKLRDKNDEESWALLEDLALYDNESWNDPRDFAKPVKAISMPHDVPSTSDRRLIELENQVQRMMGAHLSQSKPVQVNKIAFLFKIYSDPHDTQYCMEDPERAFIEYASTRTDEAGNKWYTFKPEENSIGPSWKSHPNLRWRQPQNAQNNFSNTPNRFQSSGSYPNQPFNNTSQGSNQSNLEGKLANFMTSQDAKTSWFEADFKQYQSEDQLQVNTLTASENETPTLKELKKTLEDEFADLHLNRPVLKVLAHVPMYDAILDKYIVSIELGENGSQYIQSITPEKMKDPGLFILPCRLGDSKPFDTLADLGSCVNLLPLKLFKELKVGLLVETDDVLGLADETKSYPIGTVRNVEVHVGKLKLFEDFHVVDMEREPTCPLRVGRRFLATANTVIDCKKANIAIGE
ncbi:MAK10-like protein [Tanacetum coccineum]